MSLRKPWVTLGKNKDMYFNAKALELLGQPEAVRFLFDTAQRLIGIRKESPKVEQAFPIKRETRDSGTTGRLQASLFCTAYGIKPDYRIAFHDIHIDADGIMILDLKTATRIRRISSKLLTRDELNAKAFGHEHRS